MRINEGVTLLVLMIAASAPSLASAHECAIFNVYEPAQLRKGLTVSVGLFGVEGIPNYNPKDVEALRVFAAEKFKEVFDEADHFGSVAVVPDQITTPRTDLHLEGVITSLQAAGSRWMRAAFAAGGAKAQLRGTVRLQSREVLLDFECEGSEVGGLVGLGGWVAAFQSGEGRMRKNFDDFAKDLVDTFKDLDEEWQKVAEKGVKKGDRSEGKSEHKKKEWRQRASGDWTPEDHSKEVATYVVETESKDWFRVHALWLTSPAYRSNAYLNEFEFDGSERDLEEGLLPDLAAVKELADQDTYLIGVTFESGASDGTTKGNELPFFWKDDEILKATYLTRAGDAGRGLASDKMVKLRPYLGRRRYRLGRIRWRHVPVVFAFPMKKSDGTPLIQSLNDEIELHTSLREQEVVVRFRLADFELANPAELRPMPANLAASQTGERP